MFTISQIGIRTVHPWSPPHRGKLAGPWSKPRLRRFSACLPSSTSQAESANRPETGIEFTSIRSPRCMGGLLKAAGSPLPLTNFSTHLKDVFLLANGFRFRTSSGIERILFSNGLGFTRRNGQRQLDDASEATIEDTTSQNVTEICPRSWRQAGLAIGRPGDYDAMGATTEG
jgi:hypothetical protein